MNPDSELIEKIISSLKESKLMSDEDLKKFENRIGKDQITEEDILIFLENKIIIDTKNE